MRVSNKRKKTLDFSIYVCTDVRARTAVGVFTSREKRRKKKKKNQCVSLYLACAAIYWTPSSSPRSCNRYVFYCEGAADIALTGRAAGISCYSFRLAFVFKCDYMDA